jgi:hypothetical protein
MDNSKRSVDAMLAVACSRTQQGAALLSQLRLLHDRDLLHEYALVAIELGEAMTIAGRALEEAHRLLLLRQGIPLQTEKGGWVH